MSSQIVESPSMRRELRFHARDELALAVARTIRTALVTPDAIHFAAGGGITADSDPDAEFEETLHKAEGMRLALGAMFGGLELDTPAVHAG